MRPARALLPLLLMAAGSAHAASGQSSMATGVAGAVVIRPLTVTALADMDFGTITHAPGVPGSVTVSPGAAGASVSGGASVVCAGGDCAAAHAAKFAVNGEAQRSYAVTLPGSVTATGTLSDAGGGAAPPLQVGALTMKAASGSGVPRLDSLGNDSFAIGGTIALPADLPAAHYHASFAVIVNYI